MSVLHSIVSVWRSEGIGGVLKRANLRVQSNLPSGNVSNYFVMQFEQGDWKQIQRDRKSVV